VVLVAPAVPIIPVVPVVLDLRERERSHHALTIVLRSLVRFSGMLYISHPGIFFNADLDQLFRFLPTRGDSYGNVSLLRFILSSQQSKYMPHDVSASST